MSSDIGSPSDCFITVVGASFSSSVDSTSDLARSAVVAGTSPVVGSSREGTVGATSCSGGAVSESMISSDLSSRIVGSGDSTGVGTSSDAVSVWCRWEICRLTAGHWAAVPAVAQRCLTSWSTGCTASALLCHSPIYLEDKDAANILTGPDLLISPSSSLIAQSPERLSGPPPRASSLASCAMCWQVRAGMFCKLISRYREASRPPVKSLFSKRDVGYADASG